MPVSALLTIRDEEEMIEGCLRSLGFCDEIVVVIDSRTRDRTEDVARQFTDRVYVREFVNFAEQRNYAASVAKHDWVLNVDADERVTPQLASEIVQATSGPSPCVGFEYPRVNVHLGRRMYHGGWLESQVRLFRRDRVTYRGAVHEKPALDGPTGRLSGELWHFTHRSLASMLDKAILYGNLEAQEMLESGHPPVTTPLVLRKMGRDFAWRMVRRSGWRDGMPGVIEGFFQPFAIFCTYAMLWEKQQAQGAELE